MDALRLIAPVEPLISRLLAATPARVNRLIAGRPIEVDGQTLDSDAQAMIRLLAPLAPDEAPESVEEERAERRHAARLARGRPFRVDTVAELSIPGASGMLEARLYVPREGSDAIVVYFHGGGYVVGDLDTHDQVCRFLCSQTHARVLSVAYRLAPEHPFPAAFDDGLAAFTHVATRAAELGADPSRVSIGGDSAGAGIAAAVSIALRDGGGPRPAQQLLIYPWCDLSRKRRSYELFRTGFYLTESDLDRWAACYAPPDRADPRASPLCCDDLAGLPDAHILVAGFDPLRDEGLELAERLRSAGNEVRLTLGSGLLHGFVNAAGISAGFRRVFAEYARGFDPARPLVNAV
jgi:acetyl esterase